MRSSLSPIYILFIYILVSSCISKEESVPSIAGETVGMYNGMRVYLKEGTADGSQVYIDTAIIIDNKFDFGLLDKRETSAPLFLEMDTAPGMLSFASENQGIYIKTLKDSLMYSTIDGGIENQVFSRYRNMRIEHGNKVREYQQERNTAFEKGETKRVEAINEDWKEKEEEFRNELKELMLENPNRLVAPTILDFLLTRNYVSSEQARVLYNKLGDQIKQTDLSAIIDKRLKKFEVTAIGSKAPYFEGKSPDGSIIKLPEVLGEVTLIDFWASWCGPCRVENPNIVEAYNKYHYKGFNIISVSLDQPDAKEAWVAAIEKDQMNWNHISRLAYWSDPIAAQYNVTAIPASFLLDKNGVIIAKDLRGNQLSEKLKSLLN
ncbi:TlpA disulfide reductase family protein [Nonlabens marinus]|uniref:Disulfide interchange protein n=1 Tax=Nonlabens marinus S1-08 TaxID=1454201 RepID=W8W0J4_9FLAO|nr:TlpA disulfide reductase family protein [Nonlabens marinus]BAO56431.1 disulfide interchange protein [Nonlabens marinus S1-08]